eukprot:1650401-Lingulodinium_polyedra.AAC.1
MATGLHPPTDCDIPLEVLRNTELVVFTPCAAHDANNAFKWGVGSMAYDRCLLRDIYVAVESLKNSFTELQGHIMDWVKEKLDFARNESEWEINQARQLWHCLGLEPETVEILADTLQL